MVDNNPFDPYPSLSSLFNLTFGFFKTPSKQVETWRYQCEDNVSSPLITAERYIDIRQRVSSSFEVGKEQLDVVKSLSTHINMIESEFQIPCDKIFSCQWLNDIQVVMTTKDNKIIVLDTDAGRNRMVEIPTLNNPCNSYNQNEIKTCGIYGLSINQDKSFLATGTLVNEDIAIYSLPAFEPIALLKGHCDLVFTLTWLDNYTLVSGSRDKSIITWKINAETFVPGEIIQIKPHSIKRQHSAKVRSINFNKFSKKYLSLAGDETCKLWDANTSSPLSEYSLMESKEAISTASDPKTNLFAVGTQSMISILDPRSQKGFVHLIDSLDSNFGVRSLVWKDYMITIGGGLGRISHYDLRAQKYHTIFRSGKELKCYTTGEGWLHRDESYHSFFSNQKIPNAVYSLSYDESGQKLFATGGPLQVGLRGGYAALWQ